MVLCSRLLFLSRSLARFPSLTFTFVSQGKRIEIGKLNDNNDGDVGNDEQESDCFERDCRKVREKEKDKKNE